MPQNNEHTTVIFYSKFYFSSKIPKSKANPDPVDFVPDQDGAQAQAPRQLRRRDFFISNFFDEQFWNGVDPAKKQMCIEKLYEAMFFPVEMKNIVNLDYFIKHGIGEF